MRTMGIVPQIRDVLPSRIIFSFLRARFNPIAVFGTGFSDIFGRSHLSPKHVGSSADCVGILTVRFRVMQFTRNTQKKLLWLKIMLLLFS